MNHDDNHYFDHEADIGIIGRGKTLENAFESAAAAMFGIMASLSDIHSTQSIDIQFDEPDVELALVIWLNQLIAAARQHNLVLHRFQLQHHHSSWHGKAWGEPWRKDLIRGTEVKGATLTMLSVQQINDSWEARCVVDV